MTIPEAAARLRLSAGRTAAIAHAEGWRIVGTTRSSRTGPPKNVYDDADVLAYAERRAAQLRAEADRIWPVGEK